MKPFSMTALMNTWMNGWTTSFRTHYALKKCVFGCDAQDRLSHYVECADLWNEIYRRCGFDCEISIFRSLALGRAGEDAVAAAARNTPTPDATCLAIALDTFNNVKAIQNANWRVQVKDSHRRTNMML